MTTALTAVAAGDPKPRFQPGDLVGTSFGRFFAVLADHGRYVRCVASDGAETHVLTGMVSLVRRAAFPAVAS